MRRLLRVLGIVLCIAGVVLGTFAAGAYFSPSQDPTGANVGYDQAVEAYNEQAKKLAEAHPDMPPLPLGQTVQSKHQADTQFAMISAAALLASGLAVTFFARPRKSQVT